MPRSFFKNYKFNTTGTDLYSFGVCTGESMKQFMTDNTFRKSFGFDSFEGLPEETIDVFNSPDWNKGDFDAAQRLGCKSKEEAIQIIYSKLKPLSEEVYLIEGFYDKVLTDDIVTKYDMKPAKIVEIDCDIYSSAYCSLDFMCRNKLILPGCCWYFDDWGGTLGNAPEFSAGESRAHAEICEKYNIVADRVMTIGCCFHICTLYTKLKVLDKI